MRPSGGYVTIPLIMNYSRFFSFFLVLFFVSGCAWFGFFKKAVDNKTFQDASVTGPFVETDKIVDAERLKKGGKLLVVPFPSGANVMADQRSDKIALMIVKGIADELKESRFKVLDNTNAQEAELIITGHLTGVEKSFKWNHWLLKTPQNTVSIEGRMVDATSNATVAVFMHTTKASAREKDPAQLGYDIGRDIGRYIMSSEH